MESTSLAPAGADKRDVFGESSDGVALFSTPLKSPQRFLTGKAEVMSCSLVLI
jgi:hypothetical protein